MTRPEGTNTQWLRDEIRSLSGGPQRNTDHKATVQQLAVVPTAMYCCRRGISNKHQGRLVQSHSNHSLQSLWEETSAKDRACVGRVQDDSPNRWYKEIGPAALDYK